MENLSKKYIEGLKKAYYDQEGQEIWDHFESIKHGIHKEDEEKLMEEIKRIKKLLK